MTRFRSTVLVSLWLLAAGAGAVGAEPVRAQQGKAPAAPGKMSAPQLIASADAGNADSQFAAAALILIGGMPANAGAAVRDPARAEEIAVQYLTNASAQGNAPAQHLLGTLYLSGKGVPPDPAQAKALFLKSATVGNTDAQNALGQMLRKGLAGPRDDEGAVAWFDKAAAAGNMLALTNLGYMYSGGYGVPKSEEKALEMTRRAAQADVPEAQHNLGLMYYEGKGVEKSTPDAVDWYRRAAEQGYSPSALNVGFVYAKAQAGGEVRAQLVEAVKWFALAATSTDVAVRDTAKKALAYVAERVPPDVMLDGSEAAQKWAMRQQLHTNSAKKIN